MSNVVQFPNRPTAEPYLTRAEVATHYGISLRTVDNWIAQGAPSYTWKNQRLRRFKVSELDAWRDRQ